MLTFFVNKGILSCSHHGFLPNRSTASAIFESLSYIIDQLDNRKYVAGIYFDLSKAFDLMDHDILLNKLYKYGIRGISNNLIKSYLTDRSQTVCLTSVDSHTKRTTYSERVPITQGVPQGSILGPLLFLIFVNNIQNNIHISSLYQFADDTSCIVAEDNISNLSVKATQVVSEMAYWADKNKQQLNINKTGLMVFKNQAPVSLYVPLNGQSIKQLDTMKFLGVNLDKELCWSEQVNCVLTKVNSACCVIRYVRDQLSISSIKIFYYAYVYSIISYSIMFWYHSVDAQKIFIAQKRIIRTMLNIPRRHSCSQHFKTLGIMTVPSIYIYNIAVYARKNISFFTRNNDIYDEMDTRGGSNLRIPMHRTTFYEKGPHYNCIRIYNSVPQHIKQIEGLNKFKKELKNYLITNAFYSLADFISN